MPPVELDAGRAHDEIGYISYEEVRHSQSSRLAVEGGVRGRETIGVCIDPPDVHLTAKRVLVVSVKHAEIIAGAKHGCSRRAGAGVPATEGAIDGVVGMIRFVSKRVDSDLPRPSARFAESRSGLGGGRTIRRQAERIHDFFFNQIAATESKSLRHSHFS